MIGHCKRVVVRSLAIAALFSSLAAVYTQPPIDADWRANATIDSLRIVSDEQLGAAQGVSYRQDRLYFYGDVYLAKPRVGIIREYTLDLKPTGRDIRLARHGKPLIRHPTGPAWDAQYGCFLGDTVNKVATIYELDWDRALKDGNLDAAVLAEIHDDAAVNGCRPEYVTIEGRRLLATADYGSLRPGCAVRSAAAGRDRTFGLAGSLRRDGSLRSVQPEPVLGRYDGRAYLRRERGGGAGLETPRFQSAKGGGHSPIGQVRGCARSFSGRIASSKVGCGCPTAAKCL